MSFLKPKDAVSLAQANLLSGIKPYEHCHFDSRSSFLKNFSVAGQTAVSRSPEVTAAILRNKSCTRLFLTSLLAVYTRNAKQELAYLVLDDERVELDGLLEFLRRHNCLWNDGPEIVWLVQHDRLKSFVKACSLCHRKWNTVSKVCSVCDKAICLMCAHDMQCSGCRVVRCEPCHQQASGGSRYDKCQECDSVHCSTCVTEKSGRCRRCQSKLCTRCSNWQENICRGCDYDY